MSWLYVPGLAGVVVSYYWLCGKRKKASGSPVVFLLPRSPILWALWSLVLSTRNKCAYAPSKCIHPCPLQPILTYEIELDDLEMADGTAIEL